MTKFDYFFTAIAAIQYHPANPKETRMSLEEMAIEAHKMLEISEQCNYEIYGGETCQVGDMPQWQDLNYGTQVKQTAQTEK
jgi:hypothetical protein